MIGITHNMTNTCTHEKMTPFYMKTISYLRIALTILDKNGTLFNLSLIKREKI